ncbi:hypothetical protein F5B21DRAFT_479091, partial [Xylaria acuta]
MDVVARHACDRLQRLGDVQPTPGQAAAHSSPLHTHTGSITEWSMLERGLMVDYAAYGRMDMADWWMCYPAMPAADFFKLWQARWEKFVWIPVYNPRGGPATTSWWYRAIPGSDEDEYILVSDAEYEPIDDESDNSGTIGSSVVKGNEIDASGNGDESASNTALSDREVDDILDDDIVEDSQEMRIKFTSEAEESVDEIIPASLF